MLKAGDTAPIFDLPNADMEMISVAQFNNKQNVVLYFYPKDDTPGCTLEAINFSDLESEFAHANCVILGVSMDDCLSHASFRDKHGLTVELLADVDGEVCAKYGVLQTRPCEGGNKTCIQRSTFIIDYAGIIRQALYGVSACGHVNKVLNFVKQIKTGQETQVLHE